jgi:uncharacterized protein with HEPN domain
MSSRTGRQRVEDILIAIAEIQAFTLGKTLEDFEENQVIFKAVLYNFIVIEEATRNIPLEVQARFPQVPWRLMNDMRNAIAHEYFQIDIERIWLTITDDLPLVISPLRELLEREDI